MMMSLLLALLPLFSHAAPLNLSGINYSLRIGPDWAWGDDRCKPYERVVRELTQLKDLGVTDHVRVYSMTDCDTALRMLRAATQVRMKLWLGIWVGPDEVGFQGERERLLYLLNDPNNEFGDIDWSVVTGMHVSSEAVYREDLTANQALSVRNTIKDDLDFLGKLNTIPITIADIGDSYARYSQLMDADPLALTANVFPFWEKSAIDINGHGNAIDYPSAAEYLLARTQPILQRLNGRRLIISETGWADAGSNQYANPATPQAMAKWMRDFVCLARARGWEYFWFDSYDSDWRRVNEAKPDNVEGHFGIFDESGTLKSYIRDLVIDCSAPYTDIDPFSMEIPVVSETPETPTPTGSPPVTDSPTGSPVMAATPPPTPPPTDAPTTAPVAAPITASPTGAPAVAATDSPTGAPAVGATASPTGAPSAMPTGAPAVAATGTPTGSPVIGSTPVPTASPVTPAPNGGGTVVTPATDAPVTSAPMTLPPVDQAVRSAATNMPVVDDSSSSSISLGVTAMMTMALATCLFIIC